LKFSASATTVTDTDESQKHASKYTGHSEAKKNEDCECWIIKHANRHTQTAVMKKRRRKEEKNNQGRKIWYAICGIDGSEEEQERFFVTRMKGTYGGESSNEP